jgi:hypothetical protein
MDSETLSLLGGSALSLALAYTPGLAARYAGLDGVQKRLLMLVALALTALAAFLCACVPLADGGNLAQVWGWRLGCDRAGAAEVVRLWLLAVCANQSTFSLSVRGSKI